MVAAAATVGFVGTRGSYAPGPPVGAAATSPDPARGMRPELDAAHAEAREAARLRPPAANVPLVEPRSSYWPGPGVGSSLSFAARHACCWVCCRRVCGVERGRKSRPPPSGPQDASALADKAACTRAAALCAASAAAALAKVVLAAAVASAGTASAPRVPALAATPRAPRGEAACKRSHACCPRRTGDGERALERVRRPRDGEGAEGAAVDRHGEGGEGADGVDASGVDASGASGAVAAVAAAANSEGREQGGTPRPSHPLPSRVPTCGLAVCSSAARRCDGRGAIRWLGLPSRCGVR